MDEARDSSILSSGGVAIADASTARQPENGERPTSGLSQAEAARLLQEHGYNELAEEKTNSLLKFLSYFWGPIPWMIEIAAILSAVVQHWPDFAIILVLRHVLILGSKRS